MEAASAVAVVAALARALEDAEAMAERESTAETRTGPAARAADVDEEDGSVVVSVAAARAALVRSLSSALAVDEGAARSIFAAAEAFADVKLNLSGSVSERPTCTKEGDDEQ